MRIVLLFIFLLYSNLSFGQKNDFKLYNQARKFTYEKKWTEAIKSYEQLKIKYPDSRYTDDADFWTAYILEKENKSLEAFKSYQTLINNYPGSAWVDDALIHQILIAEKFVREGKSNYLDFLADKLNHKDKNVRYQAALSLGKLGQKTALPALKEIVANGDEDLSTLAKSVIDKIDRVPIAADLEQKKEPPSDIEILLNARKEGSLIEKEKKGAWDKLFIETKRYKTYLQLNKKGADWTEMELITYGLWHILPEDQFYEFFALTDDYDKSEWLRKFWKKWDPTPTTVENERKEEFMRRINFARAEFGKEWNFRHLNYLKEQYLRTGWSVAPWDCRGELYIKYGEPDFRDISEGFEQETWLYYRYNIDFVLKPYVTNIFGNGIQPGPMSRIVYKKDREHIQAEYIFKPDFKFDIYRNFEAIKKFKLKIDVADSGEKEKRVDISYLLSGNEFKFKKSNHEYIANFQQSYVIYDEDLEEVVSDQKELTLTAKSSQETRLKDNFKINFDFSVAPGYYTLAVRIKDLNSKKLGIFLREFQVE